jgi:hypothetical protein
VTNTQIVFVQYLGSQIDDLPPACLAKAIQGLAAIAQPLPPDFASKLDSACAHNLPDIRFGEIAIALCSFARLGHSPATMLQRMETCTARLQRQKLEPHQAVALAWALQQLKAASGKLSGLMDSARAVLARMPAQVVLDCDTLVLLHQVCFLSPHSAALCCNTAL